jgi:hypothetical protein
MTGSIRDNRMIGAETVPRWMPRSLPWTMTA